MYEIIFFTTSRGDSPVREFLDDLAPRAQEKAAALIDLLLHGLAKKTDRLPSGEIRIAENRLAEFAWRYEKGEVEL